MQLTLPKSFDGERNEISNDKNLTCLPESMLARHAILPVIHWPFEEQVVFFGSCIYYLKRQTLLSLLDIYLFNINIAIRRYFNKT